MSEIKVNSETIIIGIDPDTNKSGFATFQGKNKFFLHELSLWEVFYCLRGYIVDLNKDIKVRLEAGHTLKSTWHKGGNGMAKRVGANHEIGRQIEKFCIEFNIHFELVKPCGLSQISHETFCKITGWNIKKLTNPEKRVAGLLAFKK